MFHLYDGVLALVVWLLLVPRELAAVACGRSTPERLAERLGRPPRRLGSGGRLLVVHAVSVGEMAAAAALVRHWVERHPADRFVLTAGNRDGLAAGERLAAELPAVVAVVPLPWDRRRALRRWLQALAPDLVVGIECEVWPRLFLGCRELGIPLALASARLYPRDVARYRLLPAFFRRVLAAADWIGVQSAAERTRWCAIGAPPERVEVVGNLKYDTPAPRPSGPAPRKPAGAVWIVAASTHPGEERRLLRRPGGAAGGGGDAATRAGAAPPAAGRGDRPSRPPRRLRGAVARRERARFGECRKRRERRGARRILVVDRFGWLPAAMAVADLVVLGGTFVRHGGHNPLEAARAGRALLVGPHSENFADVMSGLRAAGALREVAAASALPAALAELLLDAAERRRLGACAAVAAAAGSCVGRYAERLEALLAAAQRAGPEGRSPGFTRRRDAGAPRSCAPSR